MLLAVEGGGFFSSSATGYSKGLTLLLIGHSKEDKLMRVAPLNNHYQFKADFDKQLATKKSFFFRRCGTFICFHCPSKVEGPTPNKADHVNNSESVSDAKPSVTKSAEMLSFKSNLKKKSTVCDRVTSSDGELVPDSVEEGGDCTRKKRIQWTDTCGGELVEIREFEPSDDGSSDQDFEFELDGNQKCGCVIQ